MTGENLGHKPGVVNFEYSPLCEALNIKAKSKRNKIVKIDKKDKNLFYNSQHSFAKFKDISEFREMSLDSMHKRLQNFYKIFFS